MSSFDSNNSDNLSNMFQKELDKRFVQYVADKMDPIKVAERSAQNAEALLLHERYTPKSSLLGYEASVCETCLAGQVQSILSYGAPATGTRTVDLPKHMCLEKDLEAVGHLTSIQKASKIKTAWKNVEESLIRVVENWGKKRKMLLSFPWYSQENSMHLGIIKKGHWAWYVAKPTICTTVLTEPLLRDFLEQAHSTTGIFTMTLDGGSTLTKKFALINEYEIKPSSNSRK